MTDIPLEQHPEFIAWCRSLLDLPPDAELDADQVNRAMTRARVLKDTSVILDDAYAAVLRDEYGSDPDGA